MKPLVSLKLFAENHVEGVSKTTQFQVDPRIIEVEDGFNARPLDPEHVACIKTSYASGAILPPVFVRVDNGKIIMVDGHHRLAAALELIAEGQDVLRLDAIQFRGNDADRIAHMLTSNAGKNLTPLEMGIQYKKLAAFGWKTAEIAAKVGKSRGHVDSMIALAESDSDVQGMVRRGEVAAHVAVAQVKKHGSGAGAKLATALTTAKANGKAKVTLKTITPVNPAVQDALRYRWLRDNGKLAYYGSEAAEIDGVINDMMKVE